MEFVSTSCFITPVDKEKMAASKASPKPPPTAMIDQRNSFDGLSYTDERLCHVWAIIEHVYSTIATTENFVCHGGKLFREILEGILES